MVKLYKKGKVPVVTNTTAITPYKSGYRKRKRRSTRKSMGVKVKLPVYALAQSNPFSPEVVGVKIPDSATTPSVGFPDLNIITLNCSATAANFPAWAFFPSSNYYNVPATAAAGAWTWPATYGSGGASSAKANIASNFAAVRPVAHGIRLVANQSITSAQGFVHICLCAMTTYSGTTWNLPVNIGEMQRLPGYRRVSVSSLTQRAAVYVNKYMDETSYRYVDPADPQTATDQGDLEFPWQWNVVVVALEGTTPGAAAVGILEVENLVHFEGIVKIGSSLAVPATPAAPSNPNLTAGVSRMVAKKDPLIIDEGTAMEDTLTTKIDTQNFCDAECKSEILADTLSGTLQGLEVGYQAGGVAGAIATATAGGLGGFGYGVGRQARRAFRRLNFSPYSTYVYGGDTYSARRSRDSGANFGNNNNQIV